GRRDPGPGVLVAGESEAGSLADDPASLPHEAFLQHEIQVVAALRGLDHHRVSRVLVDLERGQGVGDEGDSHGFTAPSMKSTTAFTSASDRVRLPPLGGIAPFPLSASSY